MSSVVHFKFRSSLKFDSIRFNGHEISIHDLKEEIVKAKKLDKFMEDYDLMITNDQTKNEYKADDYVPRNSSVIVARFPITKSKRDLQKKVSSPVQTAESDSTLDCITKMTDVASLNLSEEDKLITVMDQGNREFDSVNYNKMKKLPKGPVPKNYVCHRCGMPGHFIQKCPRPRDANAADSFPKLKRSTGIPISFMTPVDDPNTPGVLLTSCGKLAVPIIDAEAYRIGKKERPPFVEAEVPEKEEKVVVPKELVCPVCGDLLTDAVVLPCCGDSACDNCVTTELLHSATPKCPVCKKSGLSPLAVIPNKSMRSAVFNYKNETGYSSVIRKDNVSTHQHQLEVQVKTEMPVELINRPLVNITLKKEKEEPLEYKPAESKECLPLISEALLPDEKPFTESQEVLPASANYPMGEPIPIPGIKGAKMVRVLVARPGAPLGDQQAPNAAFGQMSTMNMYSLPPPPLPHNYHTIITQPRMVQHGTAGMPMNQPRNVLIYPGGMPPSRVIGPPPSLVSLGTGGQMQMAFPPRIPGAMPISLPMPGVAPIPMTEEEFYREKERLREMERRRHHAGGSASPYSPRRDSRPARRKDVFEFAEDIMYKKGPRMRRRSRSRSFVRSRSRSRTRRSSSFTTKSSPSVRGRRRRSTSKTKKYKTSRSPHPPRKSRTPIRKSRRSVRKTLSPDGKSQSSLGRSHSPLPVRKSRTPDSSPTKKDAGGNKLLRESLERSITPKRPKMRRSTSPARKEIRHSRSPKRFFRSSRSGSSRRSYGKPQSRSRSPVDKKRWQKEEPPMSYRSSKMIPGRRMVDSSRSPPLKRQKGLTDFAAPAYSPYEHPGRSQTPTRRHGHYSISRNSERYIDRIHPETNSYNHYKNWHDKYDRDRQDAQRMVPRERDFSISPHKRRRPHSGESPSPIRERSPSFKGGRREGRANKESLREPTRYRSQDRYEKMNSKDQHLDHRALKHREAQEYNYNKKKEYAFKEREYIYRNKEDRHMMDGNYAGSSIVRKDSAKKFQNSEDRQSGRDDERKASRSYMPKDVGKVESLLGKAENPFVKEVQQVKVASIKSPPPKSKVQIIGQKESRTKEINQSMSSEAPGVPQETSVRIVTKDTCKTMKITVSSKWDSDKDYEKRNDREKSYKVGEEEEEDVADKLPVDECEKMSKHKKKHKKEKKKHNKKHKSKGPE